MLNDSGLSREVTIVGVCAMLAIVFGYCLATPMQLTSLVVLGLFLMVLGYPLLMKWHHMLAVLTLNASLIVFILPGQPSLGIVMAAASLFVSVLARTLLKRDQFLHVRCLAWPLLLLILVVMVTAALTGGIGGRALGSETFGAKRYLGVLGAVIAYFALIAQPIPKGRANLYIGLFFLSGVTTIGSDIIYGAGSGFYFLFALFPTDLAYLQAVTQGGLVRLTGVAWAAQAVYIYLLARYGIRGLCDPRHAWRGILFCALISTALLGGYRSAIVSVALLFFVQFILEGLMRSRLLPVMLTAATLVGLGIVAFSEQLPLSVQRSLSFLPIRIDPLARQDAMGTLDWRFQIWKTVYPEVPNYLFKGKGYSYSGTDYYLTQEAIQRGLFTSYEDTLISGNYHSGILTLIIPFGIYGMLAFLWFCGSALWVLRQNYRYGDLELKRVNTFLLAYFSSRLLFYLVLYGQFDIDLMMFTGAVGLSIALNHGVRQKPVEAPSALSYAPVA